MTTKLHNPNRQQVSEGLLGREGVCDFKKAQDFVTAQQSGSVAQRSNRWWWSATLRLERRGVSVGPLPPNDSGAGRVITYD